MASSASRSGSRFGGAAARAGGGEERQVVDEGALRALAVGALELGQDRLGALDDRRRQAGEARHLQAVGAVGGAGHDLVQEDHVALPFGDPQRRVREPRQALGQAP